MESRSKWTDLIPDTGLRISEVFDQGDDLYTPGVSSVMHVTSGEGAQKNYTGKTGFGRLRKFDDGDDVPTLSRDKTYTTKVLYNNYGGSVEITKNQIEDRDFAAELDEMKDMSRSANYSVDESSMQLFNGAFSTTTSVLGYEMTWYGDGVPLASTIHPTPVPGGSTQSNASSTGITLGHDNFETGRLALELQKEDNGLALTLAGKHTLVVPMALEKRAVETLSSILTPETANNAINFFNGTTEVITSKFLDAAISSVGSNTRWFVINRAVHKLYYESRQDKRLESDVNIKNKVMTFTVDSRWANYVKDWRGVWASKGDNAAYAS
jgi:hypothetical protein